MNRREILAGTGFSLIMPLTGCLSNVRNTEESGGNTDGENGSGRSEKDDSTQATGDSDTDDPDVIAAPRGIAGVIGHLLEEPPDDAPVLAWNEIEKTDLLRELVEKALEPNTREETTRGDPAYEYVETHSFEEAEPETTDFVLRELPYYHDEDDDYPTGWYVDHPDQLFALSYIVYN